MISKFVREQKGTPNRIYVPFLNAQNLKLWDISEN